MELKGIYTGTNGPIDLKKWLFRFIQPFTSKHQYVYSPYSTVYIS